MVVDMAVSFSKTEWEAEALARESWPEKGLLGRRWVVGKTGTGSWSSTRR